jgi:hypothetical protein
MEEQEEEEQQQQEEEGQQWKYAPGEMPEIGKFQRTNISPVMSRVHSPRICLFSCIIIQLVQEEKVAALTTVNT